MPGKSWDLSCVSFPSLPAKTWGDDLSICFSHFRLKSSCDGSPGSVSLGQCPFKGILQLSGNIKACPLVLFARGCFSASWSVDTLEPFQSREGILACLRNSQQPKLCTDFCVFGLLLFAGNILSDIRSNGTQQHQISTGLSRQGMSASDLAQGTSA